MQQTKQRPAEASGTFAIGGDLPVFRLGFGAMRITSQGIWGPPPDRREAIAVLRRAVELGINLIDTVDAYGPEVSETLIAEALYPYPPNLVIASKGGLVRPGPGQWVPDGRPQHLREALEGSLRRLRLDHIDLYQFHHPDPKVPFQDSVGTLVAMQREGKIRHIGLSNVTLDELAQAMQITRITTIQNHYGLSQRQSERMSPQDTETMIDRCASLQIGFIPWGPLSESNPGRDILSQIAQRLGATINQVQIAWLLQRSPTMLPIPGTSSVKHLEENVYGATLRLSQEDYKAIDRATRL